MSPPPAPRPDEDLILFFAPEAGVTPHFAAQCVVARTLRERGYRVLFVRCFELFPRCPVMAMYAVPHNAGPERTHDVCLRCADASIRMLNEYALEHIDLRALVSDDILLRTRNAMQNAPDDLLKFEFDSIPFGRYCAVDLVLNTKRSNLHAADSATRSAWLKYIESGVRAYLLTDAICRLYTVLRMVHCEDYSLLMSARLAAMRHGVPSTSLLFAGHRNVDRSRYVLAPQGVSALSRTCVEAWPKWRSLALSASEISEVMDDLRTRFAGKSSHIFSPAKDVRQTDIRNALGIDPGKQLIVAFTSSLDEMLAETLAVGGFEPARMIPPQPFANQIEWIHQLIHYVQNRDDLELVVRVHPREGGVRSGPSEHLAQLKAEFNATVPSCQFIWPDDPISSYDLAEAASIALISWSTIGVECARMGVPVLACSTGIGAFPNDDFVECPPDSASYFKRLDALIGRPASIEMISRAFRWYYLAHLGATVDLRDIAPSNVEDWLPDFTTPREAVTIERVIAEGADMLQINHHRRQAAQSTDSEEMEHTALQQQLRRLIHFFCTAQDSDGSFTLVVNPASTSTPGAEHAIWTDRGTVRYLAGGISYTRFSPLCARLARLAAQPPGATDG